MNNVHQAHVANLKTVQVGEAVEQGIYCLEQEVRLLDEMAQQYPDEVRKHRKDIRALVSKVQDVLMRI